jgi:dihydrofolate synthase/folylpolyglutamate synthase
MKLQKTLRRLQRLHPKEIDLSLNRIKKLCLKLGNPQNNLDCISIIGTNGKYSTIQTMRSVLDESGINYNVYTSPHLKRINERFVYNSKEIDDDSLSDLLSEVERINSNEPITFFEILTAAFFYGAKNFSKNINLIEAGLFHRFDATNVLKKNLINIITAIGLDHLDWLPSKKRTIDRIIFEKTSSLLNSKIIISNQENDEILKKIKNSISKNKSEKIIFKDNYNYLKSENNFIYYEDNKGALKLERPNILGDFQLANICNAICALRNINKFNISDESIKTGIKKINITGRLEEISNGKLKKLAKKNKILLDGSHNPLGAKALYKYLAGLNCKIHMILGMMKNKNHEEYVIVFDGKLESLTTINIPNQKNSINRYDLKKKIGKFNLKLYTKKNVQDAISSLKLNKDDIIIITGSLYLAGEVLKLN